MCIDRISNIEELRKWRRNLAAGQRLALVPTMGSLHEGHLSLVRLAKEAADIVVVSIFVNPAQFGPREDLAAYPRDVSGDCSRLSGAGADLVFLPDSEQMYPQGYQTWVSNDLMARGLCSEARPGHFRGVCTVLLKLFHLVEPQITVFGKKDYQQFRVVGQRLQDFNLDIEMVGGPLVRDKDGLALSSRNAYLSAEERKRALGLYKELKAAKASWRGGCRDPERLVADVRCGLQRRGLDIDYLELRHRDSLQPLDCLSTEPGILLVVIRIGFVRLLDNMELG